MVKMSIDAFVKGDIALAKKVLSSDSEADQLRNGIQKELIEDSILIYRIQRAPMRRVFNIDVGDMPETKAMAFIEQAKNAVNQRRIPSKTMNNQNIMDAAYNPISILQFFHHLDSVLVLFDKIHFLFLILQS